MSLTWPFRSERQWDFQMNLKYLKQNVRRDFRPDVYDDGQNWYEGYVNRV